MPGLRIRDVLEEMQAGSTQAAGGSGGAGSTSPSTAERWGGLRVLSPSGFIITETSDLPESNSDGTVTLSPGEGPVTIAEREARGDAGLAVLAVGANDEQDVQYGLRIDRSKIVGGATESPLGVLNDPFSFVDRLNAVVPANQTVEYVAWYDDTASGDVDLAARLFTDEP
jgi:hypothetical protein